MRGGTVEKKIHPTGSNEKASGERPTLNVKPSSQNLVIAMKHPLHYLENATITYLKRKWCY